MQIDGRGGAPKLFTHPLNCGRTIVQSEGAAALYRGLLASLVREGSYSGIRMGMYEPVKHALGATDPEHTPFYLKVAAGAITGSVGSAIANPLDLLKVQMQSVEGRHPPSASSPASPATSSSTTSSSSSPSSSPSSSSSAAARQHPTTSARLRAAVGEYGVVGLWRGSVPTIARAGLLTASQIPSYDHAKHTLMNLGCVGREERKVDPPTHTHTHMRARTPHTHRTTRAVGVARSGGW